VVAPTAAGRTGADAGGAAAAGGGASERCRTGPSPPLRLSDNGALLAYRKGWTTAAARRRDNVAMERHHFSHLAFSSTAAVSARSVKTRTCVRGARTFVVVAVYGFGDHISSPACPSPSTPHALVCVLARRCHRYIAIGTRTVTLPCVSAPGLCCWRTRCCYFSEAIMDVANEAGGSHWHILTSVSRRKGTCVVNISLRL
jgi:hypothetical protein